MTELSKQLQAQILTNPKRTYPDLTLSNQPGQPIQTIDPQLPSLNLPEIPIDPTNPLSWILVLTVFLGTMEKPINATAKLIRAIATLIQVKKK